MKEISIPVVGPEVVIETPYPTGNFYGPTIKVVGVPYFFNVASPASLNFSWSVNGESPPNAENPEELNVTLNPDAPSGSTISIGLTINNPVIESESAGSNINPIYNK